MHPHTLQTSLWIRNANIVHGRGRGKGLGVPTINIDLSVVPEDLAYGIYACRITLNEKTYMGAMHYGSRPVFKDSVAFEVHIIDATVTEIPEIADIEIVGYIREIEDFPTPAELVKRIQQDIVEARGMLLP